MDIVKRGLGINVLEAAKIRIKNIFKSGLKVYCDVSGGKDSIVMMSLLYDLINEGEIDGSKLEVVFIDEEVIFDDVVRTCEEWRKKFMLIGVKYSWYTIEHRNNNCFNALENNENFIPWDRYEEDKWARPKPKFAISESPYLVKRIENYQQFLERMQKDGVAVIGVRSAESVNRLGYIATINSKGGISTKNVMYPIYDWKDTDVWKYIKDNNLDFPDVYLRMYEAGANKNELRVCNLFAIDTCRTLTKLMEAYPDMWEAVLRREPNAYLVRLYWDTEMFHRRGATRKKLEKQVEENNNINYREKLIEIVNNPKKYFRNPHALAVCKMYRGVLVKYSGIIEDEEYKKLYEGLMGGDTKTRTLRATRQNITKRYLTKYGCYEGNLKK